MSKTSKQQLQEEYPKQHMPSLIGTCSTVVKQHSYGSLNGYGSIMYILQIFIYEAPGHCGAFIATVLGPPHTKNNCPILQNPKHG